MKDRSGREVDKETPFPRNVGGQREWTRDLPTHHYGHRRGSSQCAVRTACAPGTVLGALYVLTHCIVT